MQVERKKRWRWMIPALLILWTATGAGAENENTSPEAFSSQALKKAAYDSLWRLKRAMERDGYYSARVALNIWRSNAIDAGIFKVDEYEEYKRQIYAKSIRHSLQCFEYAVEISSLLEARICLHSWKTHSEAVDEFDPELYEELQQKLSLLSEEAAN